MALHVSVQWLFKVLRVRGPTPETHGKTYFAHHFSLFSPNDSRIIFKLLSHMRMMELLTFPRNENISCPRLDLDGAAHNHECSVAAQS